MGESERHKPRRVMVLGGSGSAGRATVRALCAAGHEVVCFLRKPSSGPQIAFGETGSLPNRPCLRFGTVTDPASLRRDGFAGERFDALVSCLASRTGAPADAWAIDHQAHLDALSAAREVGVSHMVYLSAICVQEPLLAFQHAKLAFEAALMASGMRYSIVRPTAFFKSLSGQIDRVRRGKPFLVFGDGRLTACTPISDRDLGEFIAGCLSDPARFDAVLPVGGPGPALTPLDQAELLFDALGQAPRIRKVPLALMAGIVGVADGLGRFSARWRNRAELARIGRYYASHSMLVLDPVTGKYDRAATPVWGQDRLKDHYAQVLAGNVQVDLGAHSVF